MKGCGKSILFPLFKMATVTPAIAKTLVVPGAGAGAGETILSKLAAAFSELHFGETVYSALSLNTDL